MHRTPAHRRPLMHSAQAREIFIDGCEADLQVIRRAQRRRDKDSLLRRLHALRGALIVFGERETAAVCQYAEEDLQRHSVSACAAALGRLDEAIRAVLDIYKSDSGRGGGSHGADQPAHPDHG